MPPLTRREFLYYTWGASLALCTATVGGVGVKMMLPHSGPTVYYANYTFALAALPAPDSVPLHVAGFQLAEKSRFSSALLPWPGFWLVQVGPQTLTDPRRPAIAHQQTGVVAWAAHCPHCGSVYKWGNAAQTFFCPVDGSTFLRDGVCLTGPTVRHLDYHRVSVMDNQGNILAETGRDGLPVALPAIAFRVGIDWQLIWRGQRR